MAFRVAKPSDAAAILSIYSPFCQPNSAVSFETAVPSQAEMEKRMTITLKSYPWLVYEHEQKVLGYAYADQHRSRDAYKWDVDVAIYLHEQARGKGIGKILYQNLFDGLRTLGYFNAYAGITLPNIPSVELHERLGFTRVGIYYNVGFKGGAWRDVAWYGLKLQNYALNPPDPIKFSQLGL